jgi:hypothetical protein
LISFHIGTKNHYITVVKLCLENLPNIRIATTNYDRCIEQAISYYKSDVLYWGEPAKIRDADGNIRPVVPLIKPHGSANFLPDIFRGGSISGVHFLGARFQGNKVDLDVDIEVADPPEVIRFLDEQDKNDGGISPAIAAYDSTKRKMICPEPLRQIQRDFEKAVLWAEEIIIVGLRVFPADRHIWQPLSECDADVRWFAGERDEFADWKAGIAKKNVYHVGGTFDEAMEFMKCEVFL